MNGREFIRRVRRYGKRSGRSVRFVPRQGKGSHGRLWVGERFTWVPRSELGPGLLRQMLSQLQIRKEDF